MTAPENPPAVSEAAARWAVDTLCTPDPQMALARFRQQVSDAAKEVRDCCTDTDMSDTFPTTTKGLNETFAPFILPEPVDPFTECIKLILGGFEGERHAQDYADSLREALAKRGLKIVESGK